MPSQNFQKKFENSMKTFLGLFGEELGFTFRDEVDVKHVDWDYLLKIAEDNKISLKIFKLRSEIPEDIKPMIDRLISDEEARFNDLTESFKKTCQLFNYFGLKYIVVKSFKRFPFRSISDYDLIIPDELDRKKALKLMKNSGYAFLRGITCEEPYKCSCVKGSSQIDIYPRVAWNRMKVLDVDLLFERKQSRTFGDLTVDSPSAEDDLLILASHSFVHLVIRLSEVLEATALLREDLDWKYIINQATIYGTIHCLYYFLYVIDFVSRTSGKSIVPRPVLKSLQHHKVVRIIQSTVNKEEKLCFFPHRIPSLLMFISMAYRLYLDVKHANVSSLIDDVPSHFLMIILRLLENLRIDLNRVASPRVWSYRL